MSIKQINYTVTESGITPATEQRVCMQTEHNVVRLNFEIDSELYKELYENKGGSENSLVYRFDCYNDAGERIITPTYGLYNTTMHIDIEEPLTRYGGLTTVYLVITAIDSSGKTAYEMRCYPARLRIESIPDPIADVAEVRRSLSTIEDHAKMSGEIALWAETMAIEAMNRTIQAETALEKGSEFYFDGNLVGEVAYVVDDTLSAASENAIANKAVTKKFDELEKKLSDKINNIIARVILEIHPVGSLYFTELATNPAEMFGGTWERVKDKFILAAGDTYSAGSTGGEETHTLTTDEMPEHKHRYWMANQHLPDNSDFNGVYYPIQLTPKAPTSTNYTETAGAGAAHNNMPPYEVYYCWKRTA